MQHRERLERGGLGVVLRSVGSAIVQLFTHFAMTLGSNLLAIGLALPLIVLLAGIAAATRQPVIVPLGVAVLVGILPCPATVGVHWVTREYAAGEYVRFGDQLGAVKRYAWDATRMWLPAVLVTALLVLNLWFYGHLASDPRSSMHVVAGPLSLAWAVVLLFWLTIQVYVLPLMFASATRRTLWMYRNALMLALARPLTTWTLAAVWLIVLVLGSFTGVVTIAGLALAASIQHNAVRRLLPGLTETTH